MILWHWYCRQLDESPNPLGCIVLTLVPVVFALGFLFWLATGINLAEVIP